MYQGFTTGNWSRSKKSTNAGWPTGSKSESKIGTHNVNVPYVKADLGYRAQRLWREDHSGDIYSRTGPVSKVIPCWGLVSLVKPRRATSGNKSPF